MNNIDEDIEILKEKIKALNLHILNYKKAECETSFYQTLVKERNALVNVLSELETYKKLVDETNKELNEENLRCSLYAVENNDLKEKLKTYEKVAITLTRKIEQEGAGRRAFSCDFKKQECNENGCVQCIIDWARKEVEENEEK